jgi:hypothetical protein
MPGDRIRSTYFTALRFERSDFARTKSAFKRHRLKIPETFRIVTPIEAQFLVLPTHSIDSLQLFERDRLRLVNEVSNAVSNVVLTIRLFYDLFYANVDF